MSFTVFCPILSPDSCLLTSLFPHFDTYCTHFGHLSCIPHLRETVYEDTVFSFPIRPIRPILSSGSQTTDSNGLYGQHGLLRQAAAFSLYLRFPSVKKSFGGGMQGGTLNCQGFPCKQNIVFLTRHRRLAGRDPTARRWSPERRNQECRYGERRSRVFLHSLHVLHGEVYLSFLSVLCVLCGKTVLAFFREFSCFSWLTCIT